MSECLRVPPARSWYPRRWVEHWLWGFQARGQGDSSGGGTDAGKGR